MNSSLVSAASLPSMHDEDEFANFRSTNSKAMGVKLTKKQVSTFMDPSLSSSIVLTLSLSLCTSLPSHLTFFHLSIQFTFWNRRKNSKQVLYEYWYAYDLPLVQRYSMELPSLWIAKLAYLSVPRNMTYLVVTTKFSRKSAISKMSSMRFLLFYLMCSKDIMHVYLHMVKLALVKHIQCLVLMVDRNFRKSIGACCLVQQICYLQI